MTRIAPRPRQIRTVLLLGLSALILTSLNGCAALAISLAGAGAGAGISHQMNGTASRTFSESFDRVDDATRLASRKLLLEVDSVASLNVGQVTRARVGDLDISVELIPLSPSLTRVSVTARKDFLRVDGATAQEIVAQIGEAIVTIRQSEAAALEAQRASVARYPENSASPNVRKPAVPTKRRTPAI